MAKKNGKSVLDVPVEFGGVSVGQTTVRIGVRMNRDQVDLDVADEVFCGHRLNVEITLGKSDEMPNQKKAFDAAYHVRGSADVKHMGVNADVITSGLTFSLKEIDISEIARFSKGTGKLTVYNVAELPEDAPNEHNEDEDFGDLRVDAKSLEDVQLDQIFTGATLKAMKGAGLATLADLAAHTRQHDGLKNIKGLGPEKTETATNRLSAFWKQNPELVPSN